MTLNPFVFGSASSLECFDEAAPCTLEQESMNVIANNPQDKYVPWLVCMDSTGDKLTTCDQQAGVSKPASSAPADLLDRYLKVDSPIQGTPTVYVDGKNVRTSYSAIKKALCNSDHSLKACESDFMPEGADEEIKDFCMKPNSMEV